jgi:tRNA dimethylallyltransferase
MAETIEMNRPRVVLLVGSTGVGKSRLAIELADSFGGEIVSADSMQVYRYMDIGTDKPTVSEREKIPHHLIDVVAPDESFHASLYRTLGRKAIDQLHRDGKPIWVVGGTGLYIKALTQGIFKSPEIDPAVRLRLKMEAEKEGGDPLYQRLEKVDPRTASHLHPNDLFRTIRALEVFESTGMPISFYRGQHCFGERPYQIFKIGLEMSRDSLYHRIDQRVDEMIEQGLLREVERLIEMGYGPELKPMQSLGYKQMNQFLLKRIDWEEAVRQIKRDTRRYAKRQWTWFRADPEIGWYDGSADRQKIFHAIAPFLEGGG